MKRTAIPPDHPLRKLFAGLVEQVFMTDVGICDPHVTDYLAELLVDFIHIDQIYRLRTVDGAAIREFSQMHADAYLGPSVAGTRRAHLINRYIGDFTLFWTGVYPEQLRRRGQADRLDEYLVQGKRSYGIASELCDEQAKPPAALLRHLSVSFESCVHGLHLVRNGWENTRQRGRQN